MPVYLLVDSRVSDASRYEEYKELAQDAVTRYGGRYLARGGKTVQLEGVRAPNRVVLLEFPSMEAVKGFYESPEYRRARAARAGAAIMEIIAVEGL